MPSLRRTIPELDLLAEVLRRIEDQRSNANYEAGTTEEFSNGWGRYTPPPDDHPTSLALRAVGKYREKIGKRELELLRNEAKPGPARKSARDEIMRILFVDPYHNRVSRGGVNRTLRRIPDPQSHLEENGYEVFMAEGSEVADRFLKENQHKVDAEMLRRKMAPVLKELTNRNMSRRDFFRLGGKGAGQIAKRSPSGQVLRAATSALEGQVSKESPLLLKIIKALISRKLHL